MAGPGSVQSVDDILGPAPPPSVDDILGPAASPWSLATIQQHAGPGVISSAARSPTTNARVGGAPTSSHLTDQALDFVPHDGDTGRAAQALAASGVPYDQIIDEGTHVHVGWGPKMRGQFLGKSTTPSVDSILGPPPVDDILGPAPAAPTAKGGKFSRAVEAASSYMADNPVSNYVGQEIDKGVIQPFKRAGKAIADDYNAPIKVDPLAKLGRDLKVGNAIIQIPLSLLNVVPHAVVTRPLATAVDKATGGRLPEATNEQIIGTALMGVPHGKGGELSAAEPLAARGPAEPLPAVDDVRGPEPAAPAPSVDDVLGPEPAAVAKPAPIATVDELLGPEPKRAPAMAAGVEDNLDDVLNAPANRRTLTMPTPNEATTTPGLKEAASDLAGSVQSIFAPATKGQGRPAAAVIRNASATGDLLAAQSAKALSQHAAQVADLPVEQQRALVGYIENRSNGVKLTDPGLQKTADAIRGVNDAYRVRIEDTLGLDDGPSFIRDYYTHMWKESPQAVEGAMMQARQGSGRNLKARSIPTLQDGIDAGLTPVTENPIEATMMYAGNMSRYLATVQTQNELAAGGMTKWAAPGGAPDGWVPLEGIRTSKPARTIIQDGETVANKLGQQLYAPADVARVYNNWISNGFDRGDTAGLFKPLRQMANGMTQLKLGLSAFHATTMAQEAVISEIARGYGALSRGDVMTAGKAIAGAPLAPVTRAMRGDRMRNELLSGDPMTGMSGAVNDAYIRAGGRVRMDPLLRTRGAGSFYDALKNGTWKQELAATADKVFGKDKLMVERAKGIVDLGANIIQSTAAPLFEEYIPRLKQGAFASNMEDWLKANPSASQAEIDTQAHLINRSIDNRFGEMAWDNLFWHRYLKQASQMILLSPTWNLGTVNEIGGGLADIMGPSAKGLVTGKGVTQRTAYIAALATFVPLINGIMTYLKTGQQPKGMDFAAYRTGGTDAGSGEPERAMLPGYQKDVYSFSYDFPNHIGEEFSNKLNPLLQTTIGLASDKDYRGLPIYPKKGAVVQEGDKGLGDYLLDQAMPISLGQLAKPDKLGSNVSPAEKAMAVRPAPAYIQSPARIESITEKNNREDWKRKTRADRRDAARRGQE